MALLLLCAADAGAGPILAGAIAADGAPPAGAPLMPWANGEARDFEIFWDQQARSGYFRLGDDPAVTFTDLSACCGSTLSLMRYGRAGTQITVGGLNVNGIDIDTEITALNGGNPWWVLTTYGFDNLGLLTGYVRMSWEEPSGNLSPLSFALKDGLRDDRWYDDQTNTAVPEPGSLLLLASGLAGAGGLGWRRWRSHRAPRAD